MSKFIYFLLLVWQLPQLIIGFVISRFVKDKEKVLIRGFKVTACNINKSYCFSLGPFVFYRLSSHQEVKKHEHGHSIQSIYLGPFYLLAVGIPSLILFWYKRFTKKDEIWYHIHYPENWADKLGEVDTSFFIGK